MRRALWVLVVGVVLSGAAAAGQTAAEVQKSLERSIERQQLPIRDFLGEPVIRYAWADGDLEHEPEKIFTLGIFEAESVAVDEAQGRPDRVTIKGKRWTLLKNTLTAGGALSKDAVPVTFDVNLRGADRETIQGLASLLFFSDVESALKAVPVEVAGALPMNAPTAGVEGPLWVKIDDAWKQMDKAAAGFTPPKVSFAPEPEFPEKARKTKMSGNVMVRVSVGADGLVAGAWLAEGIGLGFDEEAEKATLAYKFEPARVNGQAVRSVMSVEINFQQF